MEADQIETDANRYWQTLRICWSTRVLAIVGICSLIAIPEGDGTVWPVRVFMSCLIIIAFRIVLRMALAFLVALPRAFIRACMPKSWVGDVRKMAGGGPMLLLAATVAGVGILLLLTHNAIAYLAAFMLMTWAGYAAWLHIPAPWNRRVEILLFGQKYKAWDIWAMMYLLILAVLPGKAMEPLFGSHVVKAKYAAEGVPAVGDIRTKVAIHHAETGTLPGVQVWELNGVANYADTSQSGVVLAAPNPGDYANSVQTFKGADMAYYAKEDASLPMIITNAAILDAHFASHLKISGAELRGNSMRPEHVQYMVMDSGFGRASYAYAVGVLANGDWLKAGTGYAVVEIVNPGNPVNPKIVAAWQRFKAKPSQGPICLAVKKTAELRAIGGKEQVGRVLPVAAELIYPNMPTAEQSAEALAAMRQIGWEL